MSLLPEKILAALGGLPRVPRPGRREDEQKIETVSRTIADLAPTDADLQEAERAVLDRRGPLSPGPVLALKIARSLVAASTFPSSLTLRVVFPMYCETNRLMPPDRHPNGEDLLAGKIRQLEHHFARSPADWSLTAVDDSCPEGSGEKALEILSRSFPALLESGKVSVLFLEEAVARTAPEAVGISDGSASRKGGSILFGLRTALGASGSEDVLLYTDADMSTHLGQAGMLIAPIVSGVADMMAGSRREWNSVQIKSSARDNRGRIFIHLWKRMLPRISGIIDSQAAFKAFRASRAAQVLAAAREIGFAVDLELLLLAHLNNLKVKKSGICWIDSEAESSTSGQDVHLQMLRSVAAFRRRHLPPETPGASIADLVEGLDAAAWDEMLQNPAPEIVKARMEELGDPDLF